MSGIICIYRIRIIICITIPTQMQTSIIGSDICSQQTGTFFPKLISLWKIHACMQCLFINLFCHASAAVCSIYCQFVTFSTWADRHTMFCCNLNHCLTKIQTFFFFHCPHFREILSHFLIQINKADHTVFGISFQYRCNMRELPDMIICRISVISKNGIISPAN